MLIETEVFFELFKVQFKYLLCNASFVSSHLQVHFFPDT